MWLFGVELFCNGYFFCVILSLVYFGIWFCKDKCFGTYNFTMINLIPCVIQWVIYLFSHIIHLMICLLRVSICFCFIYILQIQFIQQIIYFSILPYPKIFIMNNFHMGFSLIHPFLYDCHVGAIRRTLMHEISRILWRDVGPFQSVTPPL